MKTNINIRFEKRWGGSVYIRTTIDGASVITSISERDGEMWIRTGELYQNDDREYQGKRKGLVGKWEGNFRHENRGWITTPTHLKYGDQQNARVTVVIDRKHYTNEVTPKGEILDIQL